MSGELEMLLNLVAEGKLTAEEAAPIVAALEEKTRLEAAATGNRAAGDAAVPPAGSGAGTGGSGTTGAGTGAVGSRASARDLLAGRQIRIRVAEQGRSVVDLRIPLAAAGFAIDQVPGLSPDHRSRIVEAIQRGMTGPILEVAEDGDEVMIVIE
jgi:hypothetical protein